ncbi:unnamed protein product [Cyclocybe aegerita]|uniref:Uncharacterized protein n=1 Tax=Cyclocybe aegerita TaxID=1973307 RepID=A0A8S0VSV6_CYCAE|nr:unnamed protein product [Cyclocybe aegerita]
MFSNSSTSARMIQTMDQNEKFIWETFKTPGSRACCNPLYLQMRLEGQCEACYPTPNAEYNHQQRCQERTPTGFRGHLSNSNSEQDRVFIGHCPDIICNMHGLKPSSLIVHSSSSPVAPVNGLEYAKERPRHSISQTQSIQTAAQILLIENFILVFI